MAMSEITNQDGVALAQRVADATAELARAIREATGDRRSPIAHDLNIVATQLRAAEMAAFGVLYAWETFDHPVPVKTVVEDGDE